MNYKPHTDMKFKNTTDVGPGFPKNMLLWLFETFGFLFPEIGTWKFYVAFGIYSYIFSFLLYIMKTRLEAWIGKIEDDDNLYITKTKEQQEKERLKRQKEAEEILSKYFKVTKVEDNDLTKNDEIFNENFKKNN